MPETIRHRPMTLWPMAYDPMIGCPHVSERPEDQEEQEGCQRVEAGRPGAESTSGGTGLLAAHYSITNG